jgi:chromosome segregation ATPase
MPQWVRQRMDEKEAELVAERARRQGVERRDKTLQAQIAKEAETQLGLQRERDSALDEIAALKVTAEELTRARSEAEARETDTLQQVAALKGTVDEVARARSDAEQRLSKLRQTKAKEIVRSISPFVIAAAVATVGIWTYQLIWPAPQPLPAVISDATTAAEREQGAIREEQLRQAAADTQAKLEATEGEQQRLKEEVQRQTKATAEVEANLQVAQAEQQRQAKAATDADGKRRAAEAEQQRLKDELQRQTKAAAEADTKLKAAQAEQERLKEEAQRQKKLAEDADAKRIVAEAEQQRLAQELRKAKAVAETAAKSAALPQSPAPPPNQLASTGATGLFTIRTNTRINFFGGAYDKNVYSRDACEQKCAQTASCKVFSYGKRGGCYMDSSSNFSFTPDETYDSGIRLSN